MKNHTLSDLQRVNKRLARSSHNTYVEMLLSLCRDHANFSFTNELRALVMRYEHDENSKAVLSLLDFADSLSSQSYEDAAEHFAANQFSALIKKYPFYVLKSALDPEQRAFSKFKRSETTCRRFNLLFSHVDNRKVRSVASPYQLQAMRNYIEYVIGASPDVGKILERGGFGPGANVGVNGDATHIGRKLSCMWSVTPGAFDIGCHAFLRHAQFRELLFPEHGGFGDGREDFADTFKKVYKSRAVIVEHNKLSFVPKTTRIFRSIAVEPIVNSYCQKGIDESLRELLRVHANIDLRDQELNSEMARLGSLDDEDSFVTIDLSSASDSICIELCRQVLPRDWFYLLDRVRSKSYMYKGEVKPYSKFCSMGNGFCFPLQTLLFAAMCSAVGAGRSGIDFRVYGDDIIVRKRFAIGLISLLRMCGFRTNSDKTFIQGPFRESCGKDYYTGLNVRPVYLDYKFDCLENVFKFYNSTLNCSAFSRQFFSRFRTFLFESIPISWRFVRPTMGPADAAFECEVTDEIFLTSRHVVFSKMTWSWSWKELHHSPVEDRKIYDRRERHITMLYGALSGLPSRKTFTFRRRTEAKVRLATYGVATLTWLPPGCKD